MLKVSLEAQPLLSQPPPVRPMPPMVKELEPVVTGPLDKEVVRRIVRRNLAQVRYCYERALQATPGLRGKVVVQWVIAPEGNVASSTLGTSTVNEAVGNCVVARARTWLFPKAEANTQVSYTFIFDPGR